MIEVVAPAKINLFLHVGPRRADGLHDLQSLFVFADDGDRIRVAPAGELSLTIEGPFARDLAQGPASGNLVWRAAAALKGAAGVKAGAAITLEKRLPIASGMGGGSADAAATLRALGALWRIRMEGSALKALAFRLGADVPACLAGAPAFVGGAGEKISRGPALPPLWVALVNPRAPMPTGPVFRAFDRANPRPGPPVPARRFALADYHSLSAYLSQTRNDLEPIVIASAGSVARARDFLAGEPGCVFSRMSGSGATVFGLFSSPGAARGAALRASGLGWWSMAARISRSAGPLGYGGAI